MTKKQQFTVSLWQEDGWWIAQCIEVDVASQGQSEDEALANLKEALELHFEPPTATILPQKAFGPPLSPNIVKSE